MKITEKFHIVLFDGVCNLCNHSVDFIIRRDSKNVFKVGAIQDAHTQRLLESYDIPKDYLDSLIYIHREKVFFKSRGALEIARNLGGLWPIVYGLIIIPAFIRDPIYDWIARNRYRWFGKKETCRLPTPEERAKFLTAEDLEE
ncbi:MAG: thiol-disulfide oxidoreductase DCC family protein [Mongoliitalea sp.]